MEERCIDHDDLFRVSVDKIVNELIDPGIDDGFMPGQEGLIGKEQASKGSPVDFASVQGRGMPRVSARAPNSARTAGVTSRRA